MQREKKRGGAVGEFCWVQLPDVSYGWVPGFLSGEPSYLNKKRVLVKTDSNHWFLSFELFTMLCLTSKNIATIGEADQQASHNPIHNL